MRFFHSGTESCYDNIAGKFPDADIMQAFRPAMSKKEEFNSNFFLDSGAFLLRKKADPVNPSSFYNSGEFDDYVNKYVEFILRFGVELYANIDVIGHPELTYQNQIRLEKRGLNPIPVVHFGTDTEWLQKYIDKGYQLIGLGGLVGSAGTPYARRWIHECFSLVCNDDGKPTRDLHGFGLANHKLLIDYPWWSVDSAASVKEGSRGVVFVPFRETNGKPSWQQPPIKVRISGRPSKRANPGSGAVFIESLPPMDQLWCRKWMDKSGIPHDNGIVGDPKDRINLSVFYFEWLTKNLPHYPWTYKGNRYDGGLLPYQWGK